ncbi:cation channel sperm-associated auxiliary subunit epsilon isoform X5 [Rattus norvegicus]|uniref:cation channel sperm-associated auxiliary subunit epsilon isoform X5 n=1 Tax=Rattus norvegicus TaxID=10116 RepID=UPI001917649E|nr:cation channel sperm-associated auxiliary subunit epsilon isoform X4 [Rattus norvegicus]
MLGRQVEAVLLLWLSCCVLAVWRYSMKSTIYSIFSTRSSIILEYEGDTFKSWDIPEGCKVQNKSSPKTLLYCKTPGNHKISPININDMQEDERLLTVDSSNICFLWYYTVVDVFFNLSQNSMVLTKQMNTLGQYPVIYTLEKGLKYDPGPLTPDGTWIIHLPMTSDDIIKQIRGNKVSFQDCFIASLQFLLTFPMNVISDPPEYEPLSLPAGSPLLASWHTCIPTFVLLATEHETFQTNNSFQTWTKVRAPPGVLTEAQRHSLRDVILLDQRILFLVEGTIYLKTKDSFKIIDENNGIAGTGILGFSKRRWCQIRYLYKLASKKSLLFAWSKDVVYAGYTNLRFLVFTTISKLKDVLKLSPGDTLEIMTVEYLWHPQEVAFMLSHCTDCSTIKDVRIVLFNSMHSKYVLQDFDIQVAKETQLDCRFLLSAMPDMILWDGHSTYYSHNNFTEVGIIETDSGNTNLSLIAEGSKVHNVVADTTGNILVKMENNDLFYIKDGIAEIVPLSRWVNTTAETALVLDKSFQVNILHYNQNLDEKYQLHLQSYPLVLELQSKNKGLEDMCPYLTFQHDVHSQFYHLDKGDSLTVWTQIVYPENRGLDILVDYYGSNILTWTQNTEYEIASGFCTKSMITRFFQTTNYESVKNYYDLEKKNTGLTLIKIRPSEYTRTCPTVIPVFEISVGCDPTKYIQVQGFNNTRCHRRDFSYVIDKELLRDSPHENLKVRYEVAKYGCPRTVDMEEMFHPVVELYDENGFIKIVDANFILWEVHGRNDYMYNSTMQQNGCINEAQTWDIMIEENPGVPMEDIWGPQNYRPCFSYAIGTPGDLSQPYEIINYSNKNALKWSSSYAAMYVYRLKVLDPNYSFCNLTTYFAIESLGQIPRSSIYLVAALVFVLMLTFISVLVLSYFWYSKIYRRFIIEPLHKPPGKQKKN